MRRLLVVAGLLCSLCGIARAEEEPAVPSSSTVDWSLGAGLGYNSSVLYLGGSSYYVSGVGIAGSNSTLLLSRGGGPVGSLFLERRLARRWWGIGRVTFSYSSSTDENDSGSTASSSYVQSRESSGGQGSISFGLRSVVGSWSRVDVSIFAVMGGGGGWSNGTSTTVTPSGGTTTEERSVTDSSNWSVGAVGGFIVDVSLLQNLGVRFSTSVLSASYGTSKGSWERDPAQPDVKPIHSKVSGFDAGIYLSPSLELRVLF